MLKIRRSEVRSKRIPPAIPFMAESSPTPNLHPGQDNLRDGEYMKSYVVSTTPGVFRFIRAYPSAAYAAFNSLLPSHEQASG